MGERFFATYGDGLSDIDLRRLEEYHRSHGKLATLTTVPLRSQYGTVGADEADAGRAGWQAWRQLLASTYPQRLQAFESHQCSY